MSNVIPASFKEALLAAWVSGKSFKVVLVDDAAYTYSAAHANLSDIPSGARIATSSALTGVTTTNGVFDSADFGFTSVTGASAERMVLFYDSGAESTSTILAQIDSGTGLPLTPNGGNVNCTVNAAGWLAL